MKGIMYIWAKIFKIIRGSAIINSEINRTAKVYSGSHIVNSKIGRYTYCGYDCDIINTEIGSFCSIAGDVKIGGAMHPTNWVSTSPVFYEGHNTGLRKKFSNHPIEKGKVTKIGNDVWIGNNVLIKQGITIGNGSIIGMGSIVTKDVPPYAIVGGNPAKVMRYRFNDTIIEELSNSEWWDMLDKELVVYAENFNDPLAFIEKITK